MKELEDLRVLESKVIQALVDYLAQRPYAEVHSVMQTLLNAPLMAVAARGRGFEIVKERPDA